jgi:putative glutamine amidotransferase
MQLINVFLGGSLYQDLNKNFSKEIEHEQTIAVNKTSHTVSIIPNTILYNSIEKNQISVNSTHHQGIKDLGRDLVASSKSKDGLIESIEMSNKKFILGTQWHPEMLGDELNLSIYKSFVESAMIK